MRIHILSAIVAASAALAGCQHMTSEEANAILKEKGISVTSPADMPKAAAKTQIAEYLAKLRTYPEAYVVSGLINPRITEARISGPYTDPPPFSKGTYYCVDYVTERPLLPAGVKIRAYPMRAVGDGKTIAEAIRIVKDRYSACPTPFEPFPELEKRRDEIIEFRKSHPGELKDNLIFGMGQL